MVSFLGGAGGGFLAPCLLFFARRFFSQQEKKYRKSVEPWISYNVSAACGKAGGSDGRFRGTGPRAVEDAGPCNMIRGFGGEPRPEENRRLREQQAAPLQRDRAGKRLLLEEKVASGVSRKPDDG